MDKEELIKKWLSGSLSTEELQEFRQLGEYHHLVKISETAKYFKAPEFDTQTNYNALKHKLDSRKGFNWSTILKIAAVFAVIAVSYFSFFYSPDTNISTIAATTEEIILPGKSVVKLNAKSFLSYNESDWNDERIVSLEGEAFFKVEKGGKFEVRTAAGSVKVLGTHFNVKQRGQFFEVSCYEGSVEVVAAKERVKLSAGETFRILDGVARKGSTPLSEPTWMNGWSSFESIPLEEVLRELERQYFIEVKIKKSKFDKNTLFTGSFPHNNLNTALQAVGMPFDLQYKRTDNQVIFY